MRDGKLQLVHGSRQIINNLKTNLTTKYNFMIEFKFQIHLRDG
jgi:hypothetical protein